VELGPQHASLICLTCAVAAAGTPRAAAAGAELIKVHQQLKVWRIQRAPAIATPTQTATWDALRKPQVFGCCMCMAHQHAC